jgi:ribokinase
LSSDSIDVLVAGSLHLDIVVEGSAIPAVDETARGSSWKMVCGGKGGNQACWAARLGARTAMIGCVGRDDFGDRLLANLGSCGVIADAVSVDPAVGSGMSVAIVDSGGDYGAVIVSGSNLAIPVDEALRSLDQLGAPKILVLQNEIEEAVNLAVAKQARAMGAVVLLNAAPARALGREMAAVVDILVVNRVEAAMMSSMPVSSRKEALLCLPQLQSFGRTVVVTLGADGLVVGETSQTPFEIAPEKIKAVSTHGAGDCFVAQLSAALALGDTMQEAANLANKTAAAFVAGKL